MISLFAADNTLETKSDDVLVRHIVHDDQNIRQEISFGDTGICVVQSINFTQSTWDVDVYNNGCTVLSYQDSWSYLPGDGLIYEIPPSQPDPEVLYQEGYD